MTREDFIRHVEATQKPFRRFLVALCCGDSQLADDIAQESYIKGYLSSESFRDDDKFTSWIYRIGYNTFLNHRRSLKHFSGYAEAEIITADDKADSSFRYQALYSALDRLTPAERTSILLYYMEGYSIREISGIENVSEDAVKKHLQRGRQHLKGLLGKME
ncbi:MAG: RNA polymerase sigma factor [Muribaculaceae bacterium]|nr:RNA polymerase sigma factor [Muribaculaceae bacterium]